MGRGAGVLRQWRAFEGGVRVRSWVRGRVRVRIRVRVRVRCRNRVRLGHAFRVKGGALAEVQACCSRTTYKIQAFQK